MNDSLSIRNHIDSKTYYAQTNNRILLVQSQGLLPWYFLGILGVGMFSVNLRT